jgi:hypothetical protein
MSEIYWRKIQGYRHEPEKSFLSWSGGRFYLIEHLCLERFPQL